MFTSQILRSSTDCIPLLKDESNESLVFISTWLKAERCKKVSLPLPVTNPKRTVTQLCSYTQFYGAFLAAFSILF